MNVFSKYLKEDKKAKLLAKHIKKSIFLRQSSLNS